jgi:hypothetical protein
MVDRWWLERVDELRQAMEVRLPGVLVADLVGQQLAQPCGVVAAAVEGERDLGDEVLDGDDLALGQAVADHRVSGRVHG